MANNYYDATGVLLLDRVTPIIVALFGGYHLDESHPGDGAAYIARRSESNDLQWSAVKDELIKLATQFNLTLGVEGDDSFEAVLEVFATHFGADKNEEFAHFVAHHRFQDSAELDALFRIATCFNDGHNLAAIQFEGCWYCEKPRLFEFGGSGTYISREVQLFGTSTHVLQLGEKLRNAILSNSIDDATRLISQETLDVLAGIKNGELREQLQHSVANDLLANAPIQ